MKSTHIVTVPWYRGSLNMNGILVVYYNLCNIFTDNLEHFSLTVDYNVLIYLIDKLKYAQTIIFAAISMKNIEY